MNRCESENSYGTTQYRLTVFKYWHKDNADNKTIFRLGRRPPLPLGIIIIIIIIIYTLEFFFHRRLLLEFEWQQVSSSLQDSSQYSGSSQ